MTGHCGTCRHSEPDPNDLQKVICYGGPPCIVYKPIQMKGPNGQLQTAIAELLQRPSVPRAERACAVYAPQELVGANDAIPEPVGVAE